MSYPTAIRTQGVPTLNTSSNDTGYMLMLWSYNVLISENVQWHNDNEFHFPNSPIAAMDRTLDKSGLGLINGTLYDVLDINLGYEEAEVSATGFNISCRYLAGVDYGFVNETWNIFLGPAGSLGFMQVPYTGALDPGIIRILPQSLHDNSILLFTTNPVEDSSGQEGSPVVLDPPTYAYGVGASSFNITQLQFIQCTMTLATQIASVDPRSRQVISLTPDIRKFHSTWEPWNIGLNLSCPARRDNMVGSDMVCRYHTSAFRIIEQKQWSNILSDAQVLNPTKSVYGSDSMKAQFLSVADVYLMEQVGLGETLTGVGNTSFTRLTVHDIENAISSLVASFIGYVSFIYMCLVAFSVLIILLAGHIVPETVAKFEAAGRPILPPILTTGIATVKELKSSARLDVSIGLATSIILFLLAIPFFRDPGASGPRISVDGTGLLQTIWMFRNHPKLKELLPQVDHPTDRNLRAAGMVRVGLSEGKARRYRMIPGFLQAQGKYRGGWVNKTNELY
ncbi:hypothetical protein B0H10DRAFT_1948386 [Mycena sp. CBHHK59/15]|nr:hypothetical protein B0H10DRAFT_1948386 [Mycena sp. CBHHK59/15]